MKGIWPVKMGDGGGGHWLVRIELRPAGWSVCLPLLIFPCTIKSRSSLLAPARPGGPGKRAVKQLCCGGGNGSVTVCDVCVTAVMQFSRLVMSERVIRRLLNQDVVVIVSVSDPECRRTLYQHGKPADYFTLILEGHVQIHIGSEEFVFDGGPFMYFGAQALTGTHVVCFMATLCNRGAIIFLPCAFFLSSIYLLSFFSSPNLRGQSLDVYHTSTHGAAVVRI